MNMTYDSGPVEAVDLDGNLLVTGSCDKTVKLWDLRTGTVMHTLSVDGWVTSLQRTNNTLIAGTGQTHAITLFDLSTMARTKTLQGHEDVVTCLQADSVRIVSGSRDCTVQLWDWNGTCRQIMPLQYRTERERIVSISKNAVKCLAFDETRLVTGSNDWLLRVMYY